MGDGHSREQVENNSFLQRGRQQPHQSESRGGQLGLDSLNVRSRERKHRPIWSYPTLETPNFSNRYIQFH